MIIYVNGAAPSYRRRYDAIRPLEGSPRLQQLQLIDYLNRFIMHSLHDKRQVQHVYVKMSNAF